MNYNGYVLSDKSKRRRVAYDRWKHMLARCYDKEHPAYRRYGKRGIRVCKEWHDFDTYYRDTGDRPSPQHTGDRIDPNAGYSPDNFRWATWEEQLANRNDVMRYSVDGQKHTLAAWSKILGIPYHSLYKRIHILGWAPEDALRVPKRGYNHREDEEIKAVG